MDEQVSHDGDKGPLLNHDLGVPPMQDGWSVDKKHFFIGIHSCTIANPGH
jgi:hypothetical protein